MEGSVGGFVVGEDFQYNFQVNFTQNKTQYLIWEGSLI